MLPDPGEELFSSLLEEEERTPPDVFSDLSTVLLSIDLRGRDGRVEEERGERGGGRGEEKRERDEGTGKEEEEEISKERKCEN